MVRLHTAAAGGLGFALIVLAAAAMPARGAQDAYEQYVKTSKDFQPVKQDKDWALKAFPSWTFMPWYAHWTIGFNDAGGEFCQKAGINGAMVDHGKTNHMDWIEKFQLRFYGDHAAGKGDLHQWDGGKDKEFLPQIHDTGVRVRPVNAAMKDRLQGKLQEYIGTMKESSLRQAYALDDEISWGHFVHPCMWCVTDDTDAYRAWLKEIYGDGNVPDRRQWIGYNDIREKLSDWKVKDFDASHLMDQWTFNDSYWNNFLGDLVTYANTIDPQTPCGYEGGQGANTFGGFDDAKMIRKVQFMESYSGMQIIRSLNPHNALPIVTTNFHKSSPDDVWQVWFNLANGNRGQIGWVEKWFDGPTPLPWHDEVAPTLLQASKKIGPLMSGSEWMHDGVAIYYNHASIQLGWIMDAQAHGASWTNRNGDVNLGASHLTRKAWENMLSDDGIQFNYIDYASVIQNGISKDYRVLILPATLCLSDAEARRIREFCQAGGTVIADYMPGLWDQHGKGRPDGGALDDLFDVKHDPEMGTADIFQGQKLWAEVDQDAHFSYASVESFLGNNKSIKDGSGFNKAVRKMPVMKVHKPGSGTAVLMNLSPQWYNAYRGGAPDVAAQRRDVFTRFVKQGTGSGRWVTLVGPDGKPEPGCEITYWQQGERVILFAVAKPEITASSLEGGNALGLKTDTVSVTLRFDASIKDVRDERTGKALGDGKDFKFDWKRNEAVVVSLVKPKK